MFELLVALSLSALEFELQLRVKMIVDIKLIAKIALDDGIPFYALTLSLDQSPPAPS